MDNKIRSVVGIVGQGRGRRDAMLFVYGDSQTHEMRLPRDNLYVVMTERTFVFLLAHKNEKERSRCCE